MPYPLSDSVCRLAVPAGAQNIEAETRYAPVHAYAENLCALEIHCLAQDRPGWYSYHYQIADVREVPHTNRGGGSFSGLKPQAREGVKLLILIDIKAMFDDMEEMVRKMPAEALITPVGKVSFVHLPNIEKVSPVVEGTAHGRVAEEVSEVVPGNRDAGMATSWSVVTVEKRMVRKWCLR